MKAMQLDSMCSGGGPVTIPDDQFALHALAVLRVHDDSKYVESRLTLPKIIAMDSVLRMNTPNLLLSYFLTFGRNGAPLLRNFLVKYFNYTPERIDNEMDPIVGRIESRLDKQLASS